MRDGDAPGDGPLSVCQQPNNRVGNELHVARACEIIKSTLVLSTDRVLVLRGRRRSSVFRVPTARAQPQAGRAGLSDRMRDASRSLA